MLDYVNDYIFDYVNDYMFDNVNDYIFDFVNDYIYDYVNNYIFDFVNFDNVFENNIYLLNYFYSFFIKYFKYFYI